MPVINSTENAESESKYTVTCPHCGRPIEVTLRVKAAETQSSACEESCELIFPQEEIVESPSRESVAATFFPVEEDAKMPPEPEMIEENLPEEVPWYDTKPEKKPLITKNRIIAAIVIALLVVGVVLGIVFSQGGDSSQNDSANYSDIYFHTPMYNLTATASLDGAGNVSADNWSVYAGDSVTLTATPNEGYTFVGWFSEDALLSTDSTYVYTMPSQNATLSAHFYKLGYTLSEDEVSYKLTKCEGSPYDLEIPSTHNGKPVKTIASGVFMSSTLHSVTIPNSVTSIGSNAFSGCSALTSLTIPSSVTSIESYAFEYCSKLTSVTIPSSVTSIGASAFQYCRGLTSVTIPDSVTSVGYNAFSGCSALTSLTIPNSVTSIGSFAFSGCSALTSLTIPGSLSLSPHWDSSIFSGCTGLTTVTLESGVWAIGSNMFSGCTNLTSITIPKSVTTLGDSAFNGCTALKNINYAGTMDEWRAVSKGSGWNTNLGNGTYTVHCSNGDIQVNG